MSSPELPFDPTKLTDRQKREMMRNSAAAVRSCYHKRAIKMERFLAALSDKSPHKTEIEDARFALISASEAHADSLISTRALSVLLGFNVDFGTPFDDEDEEA